MNSFLKSQLPFSLFRLRNTESAVLYLSMFVMGGCGLAYEYTLSKIASDLLGNSIQQWAIIIGVMMFFMGIGSDVQKYFPDKFLFDQFIFFEILLGLLGAFGPISLLYVYGHFNEYYVLIQYMFISGIGLIIGFEIPLITRINETYTHELKFNIGAVLKMDYIGSLAGSLAWIFILPKFFTIIQTAFILGFLNVIVGAFTFIFFRKLVRKKLSILVIVTATTFMIISGFVFAKDWTAYSEQYLYRDRIILSQTTRYQHIILTESKAGDISCFINGHLQFNSYDEYIYHENLVHPAFAIAPIHKNILILGGGDGLALREVLKYPDVERITLCDIDPAMTDLAIYNKYFKNLNKGSLQNSKVMVVKNTAFLPADTTILEIANQNKLLKQYFEPVAEVEIINMDAAKFIEQIPGLYDIIIIDFPDPNSPELAKLYAKPFYENLKNRLAAFGIFVQQSTSPVHAKEAYLCIGRTMEAAGLSVIPYHDNVPSFGEWGWWIGGRSGPYSSNEIIKKMKNIETIEVETRYLTAELIRSSLNFGRNQLDTKNNLITTLANDQVFKYYLLAWQR